MSVDPLEFRNIIGHFATGVTVITTAAGDQLQGMTANSVTSLSLDPVMVLICVEKTTHTHKVREESGCFTINVLGEHQEEVSRVFARRGEPETDSLRGQPYRLGPTGSPILEDCLAYLECKVADVLDGGDHSIFLGEVMHEGIVNDVKPLLFYRGRYRSMVEPE
ncbi:MAG: flavin reductase family protein [Chloroflexi bacterium]|nr:flavin reductase family protein [Chloroflexota bacterium]